MGAGRVGKPRRGIALLRAGQSFSELPGDRHGVSANASEMKPAKLLAGVRDGYERDGTDDPIPELRFNTFRAEILRREKMRDAN